jgi:hypothetical protein
MADDTKPAQPAAPPRWDTRVLTTDGTLEPYNPAKHDIKPATK